MSDFRKAIETVIAVHEGGFQKRADDPGNWTPAGDLRGTKFGISAHSFPDVDIECLTLNEAEELYRKVWGMFGALDDQRVLTKVLDLAVNMQWAGHGPATTILQKAVNAFSCGTGALAGVPPSAAAQAGVPQTHLCVDGVFGPATAEAANKIDPGCLVDAICREARAHYADIEISRPEMRAWFAVWNQRARWQPPAAEQIPHPSGSG